MKVDRKSLITMASPHITFAYQSLVKWEGDEVTMTTVNGDHSVMVWTRLTSGQSRFRWDADVTFGIDPSAFVKILETTDKDVVDIDIEDGLIKIRGENISQQTDIYPSKAIKQPEEPHFDFKWFATVQGARLAKDVKAAAAIQQILIHERPKLTLTIDEDRFKIHSDRYDDEEVEQTFTEDDAIAFKCAGKSESKVRIPYIRPFVNKAKDKEITIRFVDGEDYPIKIEYPFEDGEATLLVAPLIGE